MKKNVLKWLLPAILLACLASGCSGTAPLDEDVYYDNSGSGGGLSADAIARMQNEVYSNGYDYQVGDTGLSSNDIHVLCRLKEPPGWQGNERFASLDAAGASLDLPSCYSLQSNLTAVRNQGNCGSCWAFATCGMFENKVKLVYKVTHNFSEQQLVSCNNYGYGCDGGWLVPQFYTGGAMLESCFPYKTSTAQSCKTNCKLYYRLVNYSYVAGKNGMPGVDAIKAAIYQYGPVAACVYADSYFMSYKSGVFNGKAQGGPNHAIILVGWDDTRQAFRLRNSWGTSWGEKGYMWIAYNCQKAGYGACYISEISK